MISLASGRVRAKLCIRRGNKYKECDTHNGEGRRGVNTENLIVSAATFCGSKKSRNDPFEPRRPSSGKISKPMCGGPSNQKCSAVTC